MVSSRGTLRGSQGSPHGRELGIAARPHRRCRAGDSLPGVATPELYRRVEQDLTAIADTALDIKDTVNQHTDELALIKRTQDQHTQLRNQHSQVLNQHTELLNEILRRLDTR